MKIGLIGAGSMGRIHAAGWQTAGCTIAAVLRTPDRSAEELAAHHGATVVDDVAALAAHSDLVDVCSPTDLHSAHVLAAVDAGAGAIFCEKPLARELPDAVRMVQSCDNAGIPLGVGHVLRFFPEYARARDAVERGDLGQLGVLRFSRRTFAPQTPWFRDPAKSGGVILDLMIHDLDFARTLAGEVNSVFARIDSDDVGREHAYALLSHTSGAITHVEGSWRYPQPEFHTSFELAGSKALLTFDSASSSALQPHLAPPPGSLSNTQTLPEVPAAASPVADDPYAIELAAFRQALADGTQPPVPGAEGVRTLQLALAARESALGGKPITIEPWEEQR